MEGEEERTEKERTPANQPVAGVHGQDDEGGFGFSGFIQLGKNAVKSETAFGVTVAALDGISFTGILNHLPLDFGICFKGLSATQRETGQAYTALGTKELIAPGLIDSVGQHRAGIESKFALVILYGSFKAAALMEVVPASLLQKGITVYHRKVQFLPKFCGVGIDRRKVCVIDRL